MYGVMRFAAVFCCLSPLAHAQLGGESGATDGPVSVEDGQVIDSSPILQEQENNLGIFPKDDPKNKKKDNTEPGASDRHFMSLSEAADSVKTAPQQWDYFRHVNLAADHLRAATFHLHQAGHHKLATALEKRLAEGDLDATRDGKSGDADESDPSKPPKKLTADEADQEIQQLIDSTKGD
ncbi:hypothetical protein [Stratiformator vulcanicus]|uniref:DUF4142 domain-containing protein n=1 Tax=Stratiformator vulcanicus TaxID=2527980 RepID=A0A517R400_9PLAN|nr:hypothetical protein [Stratiformator vulcanicus]QDT38608.1 hypothetical protein Pan189_30030 [Stratiformator vulcanicus]